MYAYDAYLLACAAQYRTPLLSLDGALNAAARQLGIPVLGELT
ncbi:MAG: toxin-antitoxin system, toxin component, PIN family protein [Betaproteobacteria bacterium]|nr:toxin-antitoxin system, toxin component, PIN family protein [Betaproteobacteria bacterium]